jgi:predicted alpha-1,6-mannanase (GH76 family)
VLQQWYNRSVGVYDTTGWWQSANALDSIITYTRKSGDSQYAWVINNSFTQAGPTQNIPKGTFLTGSYDDEGWWALAWLNAYDYTKQQSYLNMAITIFNDIAKSWDNTCNGGVWWSDKKTYKNAVTNELFFQIAIMLYVRTNDQQWLTWATNEWSWFENSGMINKQWLINDGLNIQSSGCTNNGQTTWTYNQGVILGALADYAAVTKNSSLLTIANNIANATITYLTSNGVLQETCEKSKNCDDNQLQFKGIFLRNLYYLSQNGGNTGLISPFITRNTDSIWNSDRSGTANLGLYWTGPYDKTDASRQSSALDGLNCACY